MTVYNANYWEDYSSYVAKKRAAGSQKGKSKPNKKKLERAKIRNNNKMGEAASAYAKEMRDTPSVLEKKMQEFLDNHNIEYQFQKVFHIKNKKGVITHFYIADFYIPSKNLIIETDGAFHNDQVKEDELRTKTIQKHYPNIEVLRWKWQDFKSYNKMKELVVLLR